MKLTQVLIAGWVLAFFAASGFSQTDSPAAAPPKPQPKRVTNTPPKANAKQGPQKWIGVRVTQLRETTRAHLKKYLQGLPEDAGLVVTEVSNESPAAVAGIERHDVLLRADGQPVTSVESLQSLLDKRNFATTARLEVIHEGMPKTVYALVLEKPDGEPAMAGSFFRGGPGGSRGGSGGRGGPGGRGPFGGGTATLTYTDADGTQQKVNSDQMGDFFRKMREDEKFREAITKQGFTMHIKPGPPPSQDGGNPPPTPPPNP